MTEKITGTGSIPQVVVLEKGRSVLESEDYDRANSLGGAASLAIDAMERDPEEEAINSLLPRASARHISKRRAVKPLHKRMRLDFGVGGRHINRAVTAGNFGKLRPEVKLLLGVGMLATSTFQDCLKTGEQRSTFLENMVNKGQPETAKPMSAEKVGDLLDRSTEQGLLDQASPKGLELTEAGMDYLLGDEVLLRYLRAPRPI